MNNELTHYGVLGMKWGKRNSSATLSKRQERKKQRDDILVDSKLAVYNKEWTKAQRAKGLNNRQIANKYRTHNLVATASTALFVDIHLNQGRLTKKVGQFILKAGATAMGHQNITFN